MTKDNGEAAKAKTGEKPGSIFDDLRAGYCFIAAHATHVRIDEERLAALAASLPSALPANTFDTEHHYMGTPAETAAYVLTLDSINFGSGYKPALAAEGWALLDNSLYFTIATRLKNLFERDGPLSAADLESMDVSRVAAIAGLDIARAYSDEFAGLCAHALNETGRLVRERAGGDFLGLVQSCGGRAARLIDALRPLTSFNDTYTYKGRSVAFYKRAQSAAADLHDAFRRFGVSLFADIDQLTVLADNDVPHVLRTDGVLHYSASLAQRIEAGIPLPSGCDEEIEIRGCAAEACERIAAVKGIAPITLDRILWHRAAEDARYRALPPHRTLFRFY